MAEIGVIAEEMAAFTKEIGKRAVRLSGEKGTKTADQKNGTLAQATSCSLNPVTHLRPHENGYLFLDEVYYSRPRSIVLVMQPTMTLFQFLERV
jgi:hypothetical protein